MNTEDLVTNLADPRKQLTDASNALVWTTKELNRLKAHIAGANDALERTAAFFEESIGAGQAYLTISSNNLARIARLIRDIKIPV